MCRQCDKDRNAWVIRQVKINGDERLTMHGRKEN